MQNRNFLLFIVLSFAVLLGWVYLQNELWPRKPKDDDQSKEVKNPSPLVWPVTRPAQREILPQLVLSAVPTATPLVQASCLAVDIGLAEERTIRFTNEQLWNRLTAEQRKKLVLAPWLLPLPFQPATLENLPKAKQKKEEGYRNLILGKGKEYFIRATITTRGGGIRNLFLPQFDAADEEGRPVFTDHDGQREKAKLELIRDDPFYASFLLYHYGNPEKEESVLAALGRTNWKVEEESDQEVVLSCAKIPGYDQLKIVKRFKLEPRAYHIGLTIEIIDERKRDEKGENQAARPFRYQLSGAHGMPVEGTWYANPYRTPLIGLVDSGNNLWRDLDETQHRISFRKGGDKVLAGDKVLQYAGVSNQYFACVIAVDDQQAHRVEGGVDKANILSYAQPTLESEELKCRVGLADPDQKELLVTVLDPTFPHWDGRKASFRLTNHTESQLRQLQLSAGDDVMVSFYDSHLGLVATEVRRGTVARAQFDDITVRVVSNPVQGLKPGTKVVHKYLLYNGPSKVRLLAQFTGDKEVKPPELVTRYSDTLHLRTITDYRSPGPIGAFCQATLLTDLFIQCTRLMHWLLDMLHYVVPNYGLAIIVLTLLVRGLMFPVSRKQAYLSMRMQEMQPEMKKIQEKFKDDPTKRNAAVMELYRKYNINPLGSCLPLLLQMPFFLGLYYALQESIHFRLASFLWIQNLAAPDMLIRWGEWIPFISNPDSYGYLYYLGPYFNLLPIFAVVLMLIQQKIMTPPPADEQQEMQQKMMKYMMIFIGIMFYKVAAGLCIYFVTSSLWGLAERRLLPKKKPGLAGANPGSSGPSGGSPPGGGGPGDGNKPGPGRRGPGGRGKQRPARKEKAPDTSMSKIKSWWQEVLKEAKKK